MLNNGQASSPGPHQDRDYTGGFNSCLHDRFKRVAIKLSCSSYWMDTPCIPRDHKLRKDEIAHINSVFLESKVTLVCDRDIMMMDLADPDLETMESILATLFVCDWNVRAWTFLEAMRATNIHLLGRDDTTVRLRDIIETVWSHGDISLVNLLLSTPHLIPAPNYYRVSDFQGNEKLELLSVDQAASVLNNRHASREDDDIVIWSLLCNEAPSHTAAEFWTSIQTRELPFEVSTAFLVSDAPRVRGVPGLSWAPVRPNLPGELAYHDDQGDFFTLNGANCVQGVPRPLGLYAQWRIAYFRVGSGPGSSSSQSEGDPGSSRSSYDPATRKYLDYLASRHLKGYRWGAVVQPAPDARHHLDLGQILPKKKAKKGDVASSNKASVLVAILGTKDAVIQPLAIPRKLANNPNASKWTWITVHRWQTDEVQMPKFRREQILIE